LPRDTACIPGRVQNLKTLLPPASCSTRLSFGPWSRKANPIQILPARCGYPKRVPRKIRYARPLACQGWASGGANPAAVCRGQSMTVPAEGSRALEPLQSTYKSSTPFLFAADSPEYAGSPHQTRAGRPASRAGGPAKGVDRHGHPQLQRALPRSSYSFPGIYAVGPLGLLARRRAVIRDANPSGRS
jgi:hypothetical protein